MYVLRDSICSPFLTVIGKEWRRSQSQAHVLQSVLLRRSVWMG